MASNTISWSIQRLARVLILGLCICSLLAACAGSSGPEATAQRYIDALMREDYAAAVVEMDTSGMGRQTVLSFLPFMRAELVQRSGGLKSSSVELMDQPNPNTATVSVSLRGEQQDIVSSVVLIRIGSEWKVSDVGGVAMGPQNSVRQTDSYEALPPIRLPTPTPASYPLLIRVPELNSLSRDVAARATVEVLETKQTQKLGLFGNDLRLAAGRYTLRLKVPGRADADRNVEIGAGQPTSVELGMGERLPVNLATTMLLANSKGNQATFATLSEDGLATGGGFGYWRVQGWGSLRTSLHVADKLGLGKVGVDGKVEYSWRVPEHLTSFWLENAWAYRPDLAEIVYVENKDIFSLATVPGAKPQRWTELGIFDGVGGWIDNDTVLVNTPTHQNVLRRDGSTYSLPQHTSLFGAPSIIDRRGAIRFVQREGALFQPGPTQLEDRVEIKSNLGGVFQYGWTGDNAFFLTHNIGDEPGSGIVALAQDGSSRWIAPELLAVGPLEYFAKSWAFEPYGRRMVLVWHGENNAGIYLVDAEQGATRINSVVADKVLWPAKDLLVYVIKEGPDMGTWQLSPNGGQPRKLFAYRATQASITPAGDLLLIANRTLWRVRGEREAELIGKEGSINEDIDIVWPKLLDAATK